MTQALHGHPYALQFVTPEAVHQRLAQSDEHAQRRAGGRVSTVLRRGDARDTGCGLSHHAQVIHGCPGVLRRYVTPSQRVDKTPHGQEQLPGPVLRRVPDDHGLASPEGKARKRRLVGHAPGQAQHIIQCCLLGLVGIHAAATHRGTQRGVMHRDDGPQATLAIAAKYQLLVFIKGNGIENAHGKLPWNSSG